MLYNENAAPEISREGVNAKKDGQVYAFRFTSATEKLPCGCCGQHIKSEVGKGVKKSMILALSITLAVLAVLALGIFVYFKFFALVYDKDGMVYQAQGGPHLCNPPHSEDDGPIDGGATDNSDLNAPKSIESTQIIFFDCRFSTMDTAEPGKLGNHIYQLHAKLENGAVRGMYRVRDTGETHSFRVSQKFLVEVQILVATYGLAQYNGHDYTVAGLPDEYGARLDVRYASRESIYANDNQDNFLPLESMNELLNLFERGTSMPDSF